MRLLLVLALILFVSLSALIKDWHKIGALGLIVFMVASYALVALAELEIVDDEKICTK